MGTHHHLAHTLRHTPLPYTQQPNTYCHHSYLSAPNTQQPITYHLSLTTKHLTTKHLTTSQRGTVKSSPRSNGTRRAVTIWEGCSKRQCVAKQQHTISPGWVPGQCGVLQSNNTPHCCSKFLVIGQVGTMEQWNKASLFTIINVLCEIPTTTHTLFHIVYQIHLLLDIACQIQIIASVCQKIGNETIREKSLILL